MAKSLQVHVRRAKAFIARHRIVLRSLVGVGAVWTIADAFIFERSVTHALVGHTAIGLGLLLALLLIEATEDRVPDPG